MRRFSFAPAPESLATPRNPSGWRARLGRDPIPVLLREGSPALAARIRRDLIDDSEAPRPDEVAGYPEVKAFLAKQARDGSFPVRPGDKIGPARFARCFSTARALDRMADFGVAPSHPAVVRAAEVVLGSMGRDGGISDLALGATPTARPKGVALHFQGLALAVLCRSGLDADVRVTRGFRFLLERRQDDGGWAWRGVRTESAARPSSHLVTGMVLRAFAASPSRRAGGEARRAAELLATRFMQPDRYEDRKAAPFWEVLNEPRLWTDVLDALDGVTAIGLGKENSGVRTAEAYVRSRQLPDGLWHPGAPSKADPKDRESARWLTLRVLGVLRRIN